MAGTGTALDLQAERQAFREKLEKRLEEIEPLIAERDEIVETLDAMRTRRRGGRQRASGGNGRRSGGKRAEELLAVVQGAPSGISVKDAASKMGMKENYLYRVYPTLVENGKVKKEGNLLVPTG